MSFFLQDLRIGARNLGRQPTLSLMIVGMLALGIAGTTAIFSIFNALFLKPLPVEEAERLVDIDEEAPKWNLEYTSVAPLDFAAWRADATTFDSMAAYDDVSFNLSGHGDAERIEGALVTHDMLKVLRLKPVLGRDFLPEEDRRGAPRVVMLGQGLWQRLFGGRSDVLGQVLQLNSEAHTIVGVLPPEAVLPRRAQIWRPLQLNPEDSSGWWMNAIGRLKPGVTVAQARQDLTHIHKNRIQARKVNEITSPKVTPLRERALGSYRTAVTVMLAAVAVVLLIACVNIAGLMLARGTARSREMGIRAALGASRGRIVGQLLTESAVLAAAGGLLGVLLGFAGTNALVATIPEGRLPAWVTFGADARFLAFSALLTAGAVVLFGLWPALDASRADVRESLHENTTRSSGSSGRKRSLNALVAGEVALAVVLLIAAGLLVQAFRKLQQVKPGFRSDNVLTFRVALPNARYSKPQQWTTFFHTLVERSRTIPGVQATGAATAPPLSGHWGNFYEVENAPSLPKEAQDPVVLSRVVVPGYFETMGIRLVAGRWFYEQDGAPNGERAVIVNETFAKRFWPGQDPIGKRLRFRGPNNPWITVVGMAGDVKHYGLEEPVRPGVYFPMMMIPRDAMMLVLASAVEPTTLVSAVREVVRQLDPELPIFQVRTMGSRVDESLWMRRTYSWLLGVFSIVALALSIGGVYGVISFSVGRRTREIGIRMALGARQDQVLGQVLREGVTLAAIGLAIGLVTAFFTARLMGTMLFGVNPRDPWVYGVVAGVLLAIAALANLAPARRAASLNPMSALRTE